MKKDMKKDNCKSDELEVNGSSKTKSKGTSRGRNKGTNRRPKTRGSNDPTWYSKNPALVSASADLAFMYPTGKSYPNDNPLYTNDAYNWPGVLTIGILPTVGRNLSATDAVNIAAMKQFTFVRKNKAGSLPFDAPDLMCMTIAMADVYSYINFLYRIYATVQLYSMQNNFIPDTLLTAQGVNPTNLRQNLADFRWGVNLLIEKAAAVAVPATTTLFARRAFLYQNLYTEGSSIKDQLYMYVPAGFGRLTENIGEGTSVQLVYYDVTYLHTVKELLDYGSSLIDAVYANADVQSMSAFILEAYGESNLIKLAPLVDIVPITPVFDIGVLEQFKNATVVPSTSSAAILEILKTCAITQDATKGHLISDPRVCVDSSVSTINVARQMCMLNMRKLLSTTTDRTDSGLVLESTRLMMYGAFDDFIQPDDPGHPESVSDAYALPMITGTEMPLNCIAWGMQDGVTTMKAMFGWYRVDQNTNTVTRNETLEIMEALSNFKFAPCVNYVLGNPGTAPTDPWVYTSAYTFWDVDNFTIIDRHELDQLHRTSILSLLSTPGFNASGN